MICGRHKIKTNNKKSFSNHMRWCEGRMNRENFKGINLGNKNGAWRGKDVQYSALHHFIKRHLPMPERCIICKKKKRLDLANISQEYKRELSDWEYLCRRCHMKKDGRLERFIGGSKHDLQ